MLEVVDVMAGPVVAIHFMSASQMHPMSLCPWLAHSRWQEFMTSCRHCQGP